MDGHKLKQKKLMGNKEEMWVSETNYINKEARDVLKATSRTFYIPISHLTKGVQEAVASAYLCMRAIDEIEDHPELPSTTKIDLLLAVSQTLQRKPFNEDELIEYFNHTNLTYLK